MASRELHVAGRSGANGKEILPRDTKLTQLGASLF
jgi:hypothetical protein